MSDFTPEQLKDEIVNDTLVLGYKEAGGEWKGDQVIADLINEKAYTINRDMVQASELKKQIVLAEWQLLSSADRDYLSMIFEGEQDIDTNIGQVRAAILSIFGAGTATRTNMVALVQITGSRAEVLWGEGAFVTPGDVGHASNLVV